MIQSLKVSKLSESRKYCSGMKETKKETWQLNVTCDSGLDPFDIKDITGTTDKT